MVGLYLLKSKKDILVFYKNNVLYKSPYNWNVDCELLSK